MYIVPFSTQFVNFPACSYSLISSDTFYHVRVAHYVHVTLYKSLADGWLKSPWCHTSITKYNGLKLPVFVYYNNSRKALVESNLREVATCTTVQLGFQQKNRGYFLCRFGSRLLQNVNRTFPVLLFEMVVIYVSRFELLVQGETWLLMSDNWIIFIHLSFHHWWLRMVVSLGVFYYSHGHSTEPRVNFLHI